MSFDFILANGTVIDGTGAAGEIRDVGIVNERITALGRLDGAQAGRRIDCSGQVVCPGFIDIHAHSDLTLLANPRAESKVRMGVTTEANGQCGLGVFPVLPEHRTLLNASCSFIAADCEQSWATTGEYLTTLAAARPAVNVAPLVAHSALRAAAMGFEHRPATAAEVSLMADTARQALDEGAVGVSFGLAYALGSFAERDELATLCRALAERDGYVSFHARNEGLRQAEALEELFALTREAETVGGGSLRLQVDHLKCSGRASWGRMEAALATIEAARDEGLDVAFDIYPYTAGSRHLSGSFPAWLHAGGNDAFIERLKDPAVRRRLHDEYAAWQAGTPTDNPLEIAFNEIMVTDLATEENRWAVGKRLDEIAETRGQHPLDATLDLLIEEGAHVSAVLFSMDEADMQMALRHPLGCIATDGMALAPYGTLGRGCPHPRSYGTYPRLFGRYVREEGLLTLPEAVRKCTSWPAERLRLADRGVIREGAWADIVVFDPATIADRATYDQPHQYPEGVELVMVNGAVVVEAGEHSGAGPGAVPA